jgi:hypothetical protein
MILNQTKAQRKLKYFTDKKCVTMGFDKYKDFESDESLTQIKIFYR